MKISNKDVDELVNSVVGEDVTPLIMILRNKTNVSEFKLADDLNITVNQVRNMLYRLYKHNLVSFVRKKDKKKGWYIYYWTLNLRHVKEELIKLKRKRLDDFKKKLRGEETGSFFICPNKCMRVKLENAMDFGFRCQECGNLLVEQNNKRTVENLKNMIRELGEELREEEEELRAKIKRLTAGRKASAKKAAKKKAAKRLKLRKKVLKEKPKPIKPKKRFKPKKKAKKRFKPGKKAKKRFKPRPPKPKKRFKPKKKAKKKPKPKPIKPKKALKKKPLPKKKPGKNKGGLSLRSIGRKILRQVRR